MDAIPQSRSTAGNNIDPERGRKSSPTIRRKREEKGTRGKNSGERATDDAFVLREALVEPRAGFVRG